MKDLKYFEQVAKEAAEEFKIEGKTSGYLYVSTDYTVIYSRKIDLCRPQVVRFYFSPETGVIFNGRTLG